MCEECRGLGCPTCEQGAYEPWTLCEECPHEDGCDGTVDAAGHCRRTRELEALAGQDAADRAEADAYWDAQRGAW